MNEAHDWLWCWHNVYNACGQTSTCPLGHEEQIGLGGSQFYYQVLPECGNSITQSPKSRCPRSWITIGSHRWGCIQRFSCHTHRHDSLILRNQPIHIFDRDQVTLDKVILEAESGTHMKEDLFFMILRSSGATTDVGSIWLTMVDRVPHCDKLLTWRRRPVGNGY